MTGPLGSSAPQSAASADVERLTRWVDMGGTVAVVARRADWVLLSLRRCDGGEEADRFASEDPALVALVAGEPVTD
ncbi:MAG: hypothetical protein Q4G51_14905 [Dermatophilus congolensis]|nr:hypothetical protein [Dermatophilus congolensis]